MIHVGTYHHNRSGVLWWDLPHPVDCVVMVLRL